ncbi:MAG: DUF3021 family protein [Lachnospiraceae bacterium]|nr:DUF3021 family protein [Lachnospiraceae bacterium]
MTRLERSLCKEIGIEFKACLYFFCILFFYCVCRMVGGDWNASILHMTEMILLTYGMGYFQLFCLNNFDEGEKLGVREVFYILLCVGIYTLVAWACKWFDSSLLLLFFALYLCLVYVCAFLVYKVKRDLDSKALNEELKEFQERNKEVS